MLDVGRRSARLICVIAILAALALCAYAPPWSAPAACTTRGETGCLATSAGGDTVHVTVGQDGRPQAESWNPVQDNARTILLGIVVVAVGGLALWRPRVLSRGAA